MTLKFRGLPACSCLVAWLPVFEAELLRRKVIKHNIDIYQLIGGAKASGGTHSTGGAFDVAQRDAVSVKVAREMGAAMWNRPVNWDGRGGMAHAHGVLNGCPHNAPARYQIAALRAGRNGLGWKGLIGKDAGPTPRKLRTWEAGIKWAKALQPAPVPPKPVPAKEVTAKIRAMTFNFPGADKLPNPIGRCASGVEAIKSGTPDLVGLNELVGPGTDGGPASPFAKSVHAGMAAGWTLVTPTTAWNENYFLIRDAKLSLVKQYDDVKVYAKVGTRSIPGRHVTRLVVKDKTTGVVVAFGVTHLVSNDVPGAQAQSVIVMDAMLAVSKKHGNCPIVILGDMNMVDAPKGFVAGGLKNTRLEAKASGTREADTFATYAKTKPAAIGAWIIDQIWTNATTVNGYNVLQGVDARGTFPLLRPSDHVPVIVSVTFKK